MRPGEVAKGTRWALVTGAVSGIGLAMARRLATLGYNLFVVYHFDRDVEPSTAALRSEYDVEVRGMAMDLARAGAARSVYDHVCSCGVEPDVVVNNAGMFIFRDVAETDVQRIESIIYLHVMTNTMMCRLFGADMKRRGHGYILNMSSYSIWMPWPGMAMYASTKRFLHEFSVCLTKELREAGVSVTAVCPAGVATDLYGLPRNWQRIGVRLGVLLTPEKTARLALRAMFRRRKVCVPGWYNRIFIPLIRLVPRWLLDFGRRKTMKLQK